MRSIITTFTCSVYTQRPAACRNYPFCDAQITFDSCLFLRQDVDLEALSAEQKMHYCLSCGKCCYAWAMDGEAKKPVARCNKLKVHAAGSPVQQDSDTKAMLKVTSTLPFG